MQTSLTTFSSMMSEQFAALTNSVGEIQQRLINLEENMTLSSMVSITVFGLLITSSRNRKLSLHSVEYCFLEYCLFVKIYAFSNYLLGLNIIS